MLVNLESAEGERTDVVEAGDDFDLLVEVLHQFIPIVQETAFREDFDRGHPSCMAVMDLAHQTEGALAQNFELLIVVPNTSANLSLQGGESVSTTRKPQYSRGMGRTSTLLGR